MKRIQADFPFEDYWLYRVWHKKEGRWQANLILKANIKERTTIAYARYVMSVHLKRFLTIEEHVDHIDENKSNDLITNLQILSKQENKLKSEKHLAQLRPKITKLSCSNCGNIFEYPTRNYKFNLHRGQINFYCTRQCVSISQRIKGE